MKRIYLDEFCWINLRNLASTSQTQDCSKSLLSLCYAKSESEDWIFPLSLWHLIETQNTYDDARRLNLGEIQAALSKGWKLTTYPDIKRHEVGSYLLDQSSFFVCCKIISRDTTIPDNEIARLIDGVTPEDVRQAKQMFNDLGLNSLIFANLAEQHVSFSADKQEHLEYIKILSKQLKSSNYSFGEFCREVFEGYFSSEEQFAIRKKIHKIVSGLSQKEAREKLRSEFEKLPSFYTATKLLWELISQKSEEKLKENDFTDILFLSSAIPYCDVVVTEKQWVSYAKKHKLDSKYQTTLYSDIHSLFEIE